jgi:hypothetical protein
MRLHYSPPDELMLLDSLRGMNALHSRLEAFLDSEAASLRLDADQWGSAEPHDELLAGLEVRKSTGPIILSMTPQRWLHLTGSVENLRRYTTFFRFEAEEEHHHPEHMDAEGYISPISMTMILEVCTDWIEEMKSRRH